jgi:hypothetical protein
MNWMSQCKGEVFSGKYNLHLHIPSHQHLIHSAGCGRFEIEDPVVYTLYRGINIPG